MGEKYNPSNLLIKGQRFIEDEEKSTSKPEETILEIVKLRRKKGDDKDLFDTSSRCTMKIMMLVMDLLISQICHH